MADRRFATGQYGTRLNSPSSQKTSEYDRLRKQGLTDAQIRKRAGTKKPKVVVAERGDDMNTLASKLGVDPLDLQKANPDASSVQAGAAYSVPNFNDRYNNRVTSVPISLFGTPRQDVPIPQGYDTNAGFNDRYNNRLNRVPISLFGTGRQDVPIPADYDPNDAYDVARALPGENINDFTNRVNPQPTPIPGQETEPRNYIMDILTSGGGREGEPIGTTIDRLLHPKRYREEETSYAPTGARRFSPPRPGPVVPGAEYADFRRAEQEAAYTDREARLMQGSLGISNITDRPGYYGWDETRSYGQEGDWAQIYNPMYNPRPNLGAELEGGEFPRGEVPRDAEQELRDMWNDVYMNPENKGRGGGIVGWIEERTGMAIDPEEFFSGERSEDVLNAILNSFRPDELAYLESQGILVPEEEYDLPTYGSSGGSYSYPNYYSGGRGGAGSGPVYNAPRQSGLGLVSWSI